MRTRLSRLAVVIGFVGTLMLATTGAAQAITDPEFDCANAVGVVMCDNTVDVPIDIHLTVVDAHVLTGAQLDTLEEEFDAAVGAGALCQDLRLVTVQIYQNEFDIDIVSGNVIVVPGDC
jgi:hypothetical protein